MYKRRKVVVEGNTELPVIFAIFLAGSPPVGNPMFANPSAQFDFLRIV